MKVIQAYKKALLGALVVLCALAGNASAADQFRYRSWIDDRGIIFRFDNQSGDIEQLTKMPSGPPMWTMVQIQQAKPQLQTLPLTGLSMLALAPVTPAPSPATQPAPAHSMPQARSAQLLDGDMSMAYKSEPVVQKTSARRIEFFDEIGKNITDEINDADRTANRAEIASYERSLSLISTIGINEKICGTLTLANNGQKRIKQLEVTISATKAGSGKTEVLHRILLSDSKGAADKPPAPPEPGYNKGPSVMKRVEIPTPAGSFAGKPDVRVTFIKFEE